MNKKSSNQFINEVFELAGSEYEVVGTYINNMTKVEIKHNICGHTFYIMPSNFLRGRRCPYCSKLSRDTKITKTHEDFIKEVSDLVGSTYEVVGTYVNSDTKIDIRHTACGHIYSVKPNNFLSGNRCPACAVNYKKTHEKFIKEIYDLVGNEYEVIGTYKNNSTLLEMKHAACGHIYSVKPNHFLRGNRCPHCSRISGSTKRSKTHEQFVQEVYELVGDEYKILGSYTNAKTKLEVKHNKCNHIYDVKPNAFLSGTRCPRCSGKSSEKRVQEVLSSMGIDYKISL